MLKITTKLLVPTLLLSLISACTMPLTKVEPAPIDAESLAQKETTPISPWQDAYGERQDTDINVLSEHIPEKPESGTENITKAPVTDLWQRIRQGYAIPYPTMHAATQKQLDWFVKHPEYINRVAERAKPYLHYIVDELERRNMPLEIALLPVVESAFQPFAYSSARAAGLWQFIPGTGKLYGLQQNWWYDGRRDVIKSTHAALDYLQKLHNDFGDWQLALAAYNCGEGTVGRAIKKNKKLGKATDFWSLNLPKETSVYVPKLLAISHLINDPTKYQLTLLPIDNSPFLTTVDVGTQIDLAVAAELAGITVDEMYQLNPGFNRWATAPNGPHSLVVPVKKAEQFQQALMDLPKNERVQWTRHKIKSGDSLGVIAQHYKTTTAVIKQANGLSGNNIRAGRYLLIPVASGKVSDYPLSSTQRQITRQNKSRSGTKKIHTVTAGDTWWDIANAYHVTVTKLTKWNGKAPADTLRLGQKLVIWTKKKPTNSNKTTQMINYKIRHGDSLWEISKKFKVTVTQVQKWNGLNNRSLLKPGQNLTLHIDVNNQSGSI